MLFHKLTCIYIESESFVSVNIGIDFNVKYVKSSIGKKRQQNLFSK